MRTGTRNPNCFLSLSNANNLAVNEYLPEMLWLGSVITWAVNLTCESKYCAIAELSKDACRIDIAVAPTRMARIKTKNRAFLKPIGIRINAARQIRHGETALCARAPHQIATPRATAL